MVCGLGQSPCASSVPEPAVDAARLFGLLCHLDLPVLRVSFSFRRYREFVLQRLIDTITFTRVDLTVRDVFESVRADGYPDLSLSLVFVSLSVT